MLWCARAARAGRKRSGPWAPRRTRRRARRWPAQAERAHGTAQASPSLAAMPLAVRELRVGSGAALPEAVSVERDTVGRDGRVGARGEPWRLAVDEEDHGLVDAHHIAAAGASGRARATPRGPIRGHDVVLPCPALVMDDACREKGLRVRRVALAASVPHFARQPYGGSGRPASVVPRAPGAGGPRRHGASAGAYRGSVAERKPRSRSTTGSAGPVRSVAGNRFISVVLRGRRELRGPAAGSACAPPASSAGSRASRRRPARGCPSASVRAAPAVAAGRNSARALLALVRSELARAPAAGWASHRVWRREFLCRKLDACAGCVGYALVGISTSLPCSGPAPGGAVDLPRPVGGPSVTVIGGGRGFRPRGQLA